MKGGTSVSAILFHPHAPDGILIVFNFSLKTSLCQVVVMFSEEKGLRLYLFKVTIYDNSWP